MTADRPDADELRRLSTWAGGIAQHLRPEAPIAFTPGGRRLGRKGSLAISADGSWFDHDAGKGGPDTLSLIRHLKNCSAAEAVSWAQTWLDQHSGDGELSADGAPEMEAEASNVRRILDEAGDALGTPAETYLRSRGLEPPYPSCVRFLEDARLGESALVGILTTAAGEEAGVQLGYLDPAGRKSTVRPIRQLFLLDKEKAKQGAFRIPVATVEEAPGPHSENRAACETHIRPGKDIVKSKPGPDGPGGPDGFGLDEKGPPLAHTEGVTRPLVIVEGLEDALSVAQAGAAQEALGIPGVARFSKFALSAGTDVVVFSDGDPADSAAAKQLAEAVDRGVLAGARVRLTASPAGADANSILQDRGPDELHRLIAEATPAQLSFDADVVRLAALEPLQYERERTDAAGRHSVRVSFLDTLVKAARAEAEAAAADEDTDEALDTEPVTDLASVLDQALAEIQRYVVAAEHDLGAVVVWTAHAHLVHHDTITLPVSPKLAIQSPDKGCGKSTLMDCTQGLVPRPVTGSSITAAATFRLIESRRPTLLLDEADRVLRGSNDELVAVMNSSHRRSGAYVWRVEEIRGERIPCRFSTWAAVSFAGIKELPPTLQDRSIVIRLARAKPGEVKAHLRNGTSEILQAVKRKFARWAADLSRLPEAALPPQLCNRTGDNWQPLFDIAAVAGGRWPQLVKEAAFASLVADQAESILVALLDGIRRGFGERDRLRTREILDFLLADDEYDWGIANNGKPINEAFLRERLRGVIAPAADGKSGSERWGSRNNKERGYSRGRFEDAWARYLPSSKHTPDHPAHPVHPAPALENKANSGPDAPKDARPPRKNTRPRVRTNGGGPDANSGGAGCQGSHVAPEKPAKSKAGPVGPDGPGVSGSGGKGMPPADGELGEEELL